MRGMPVMFVVNTMVYRGFGKLLLKRSPVVSQVTSRGDYLFMRAIRVCT